MVNRLHKLTFTGWALFAISFFFPVHQDAHTLADGVLPGWEAMSAAIAGHAGPVGVASGLTNLVLLATVVALWRRMRWLLVTVSIVTVSSTLLNGWWFVSVESRGDLMIGYYLWWLSFGLVAAGLLMSKRYLPGRKNDSPLAPV